MSHLVELTISGDRARATIAHTRPDDPSWPPRHEMVEFAVTDAFRMTVELAVEAGKRANEEAALARAADEEKRRGDALAVLRAEEAARPDRELAEVAARGGVVARAQEAQMRGEQARREQEAAGGAKAAGEEARRRP